MEGGMVNETDRAGDSEPRSVAAKKSAGGRSRRSATRSGGSGGSGSGSAEKRFAVVILSRPTRQCFFGHSFFM
jgi:hypothetical protein